MTVDGETHADLQQRPVALVPAPDNYVWAIHSGDSVATLSELRGETWSIVRTLPIEAISPASITVIENTLWFGSDDAVHRSTAGTSNPTTSQVPEDGPHAIRTFVAGSYDIVFIDLGMPGMPADAMSRELKRSDPTIVTVLITRWLLKGNDPRLEDFDFHLEKPVKMDALLQVVSQAVQIRESRFRTMGK